jgi:hypothetical protein
MPIDRARILCVGKELSLLQLRCTVLASFGYNAHAVTFSGLQVLLLTHKYDLVIVDAVLSEWERGRVLVAAGETPTLILRELTFAPELLTEVKRRLA